MYDETAKSQFPATVPAAPLPVPDALMKEIAAVAESAGLPTGRVAEIVGRVVFRHVEGNVREILLSELNNLIPTAGPRAVSGGAPAAEPWRG